MPSEFEVNLIYRASSRTTGLLRKTILKSKAKQTGRKEGRTDGRTDREGKGSQANPSWVTGSITEGRDTKGPASAWELSTQP